MDLFLTIANAFVTLLIAAVGAYLTIQPATDRQKAPYLYFFGLALTVVFVLSIVQASETR